MKIKQICLALVLTILTISCTKSIPNGTVGKVRTANGFSDELLKPGRHEVYGRDELYLLEVQEKTYSLPQQNVLCADRLNFKFDTSVQMSVNVSKTDSIATLFEKVVPQTDGNTYPTIKLDFLWKNYVEPIALESVHTVVSKYSTDELILRRNEIILELKKEITTEVEKRANFITLNNVNVGNFDFPDSVTKAQEQKATTKVEVEQAKANAEKVMIEMEMQLKSSKLKYEKEILDAKAVADSNKIISATISPEYLAYKQLEVMREAARGDNNVIFYPYSDSVSKQLDGKNSFEAKVQKTLQENLTKKPKKETETVLENKETVSKPVPQEEVK